MCSADQAGCETDAESPQRPAPAASSVAGMSTRVAAEAVAPHAAAAQQDPHGSAVVSGAANAPEAPGGDAAAPGPSRADRMLAAYVALPGEVQAGLVPGAYAAVEARAQVNETQLIAPITRLFRKAFAEPNRNPGDTVHPRDLKVHIQAWLEANVAVEAAVYANTGSEGTGQSDARAFSAELALEAAVLGPCSAEDCALAFAMQFELKQLWAQVEDGKVPGAPSLMVCGLLMTAALVLRELLTMTWSSKNSHLKHDVEKIRHCCTHKQEICRLCCIEKRVEIVMQVAWRAAVDRQKTYFGVNFMVEKRKEKGSESGEAEQDEQEAAAAVGALA